MNDNTLLEAAFKSVEQQQQALIAAIFPLNGNESEKREDNLSDTFDERGLAIYRNNLLATAQQALKISFPTVLPLIGETFFNYACLELLKSSPPSQGDWALWGEDFPDLLNGFAQLDDFPFIRDVAILDWHQHRLMSAENSAINQESLQLLANIELDELYLVLADSMQIMESVFPIVEIWQAHQQDVKQVKDHALSPKHLEQIETKLAQANFLQTVLIVRPKFNVEIKPISATEYRWLQQLRRGMSLGKALDNLSDTDFDFVQWFGKAIEQNMVSHLQRNA